MKFYFIALLISITFSTAAQVNYLDNYLSATPSITVIGDSANDRVVKPRDLDFKPGTNELWVCNYADNAGGTMVLFYNAGTASQRSEFRKDTHSGHFMVFPSSFAFGNDGRWASTGEIRSTAGSSTFMGPTLWSSDTSIFARVFQSNWASGYPLGSHLDMLHQSPFAMGIAHDSAMAYWVMDGFNGNICKYDFVGDHGPGYEDHSNGIIWRYTDVTVSRVPGVPSHMIKDQEGHWLYFIDGGTKTIKRMNTLSGAVTGNLQTPSSAQEALDDYFKVEGATVEVIDTLPTQPSGIDYYNNRLIVSDYATGDIYLYNTNGTPTLMGTISTGSPGIMGVKIGPDGLIWYVNNTLNTVNRLDIPNPDLDLAVEEIINPSLENYLPRYYFNGKNVCDNSFYPTLLFKNNGMTTIYDFYLNFEVDHQTILTTHVFTIPIAPGDTQSMMFPPLPFISNGPHLFSVQIDSINGYADDIPQNNRKEGSFRVIEPITPLPYLENFSSTTFPPSGWNYVNYNPNNKLNWNSNGTGGAGCLKMDNYSGAENITGQKDYLLSPRFDFSTAGRPKLSFDVAHARAGTSNDELMIQASTDCGNTWIPLYSKSGTNLATAASRTTAFSPGPTEWRKDSVDLSSLAGQSEVMFMYTFISNFGNNVYLDNLAFTDLNTTIATLQNSALSVFPNPAQGDFIQLAGTENKEYTYNISDLTGRIVREGTVQNGMINISSLNPGNYYIRLSDLNINRSLKFVKL